MISLYVLKLNIGSYNSLWQNNRGRGFYSRITTEFIVECITVFKTYTHNMKIGSFLTIIGWNCSVGTDVFAK